MYPSVTINGSARAGISSGKAMELMEKLSYKLLPKDIGFAWSGSSLQEKGSSGQILPILIMSVVFVYLFLVGLYESWMLPFAVMLVSPVALFGALFFQYVVGYSLDLYSQIGLVMLLGLSTKQAILIIEFAKDAHQAGMEIREEAIKKAFNVAFKEMTNGIEQIKDQVLKSIKLSNTDRTVVQVQADIERAQTDMINLYHKKDEVDDYTTRATKIAARIDQLVKEKEISVPSTFSFNSNFDIIKVYS